MKEIYLIRHGRQCSKLCNVDVALEEAGVRQARLAGERLKNYALEKLYSSKLLRAKETAMIINEYLELPYEMLSDIQEIDFGGFTGKDDDTIREIYGEYRKERSLHTADLPYPDGGECGEDVVKRVMPKIKELCARKENKIGIVTHGGVIRSICAHLLYTEQRHKLKFGIDLENTSFTQILYDEERELFFLERFNDFAHLEGHPELLRSGWKTSLERK